MKTQNKGKKKKKKKSPPNKRGRKTNKKGRKMKMKMTSSKISLDRERGPERRLANLKRKLPEKPSSGEKEKTQKRKQPQKMIYEEYRQKKHGRREEKSEINLSQETVKGQKRSWGRKEQTGENRQTGLLHHPKKERNWTGKTGRVSNPTRTKIVGHRQPVSGRLGRVH